MVDRINGSLDGRHALTEFFVYAVVELNGIIYTDADQERKCGK